MIRYSVLWRVNNGTVQHNFFYIKNVDNIPYVISVKTDVPVERVNVLSVRDVDSFNATGGGS